MIFFMIWRSKCIGPGKTGRSSAIATSSCIRIRQKYIKKKSKEAKKKTLYNIHQNKHQSS